MSLKASKKIFFYFAAVFPVVFLASCGPPSGRVIEVYETAGYQPHFGPFDGNGNYVDKWADNPPKRKYIPRDQPKSQPQRQPQPQYVSATPPPRPVPIAQPKPTPPPKKTVTVKPKKKPPITHTVRKGDTLYGLSRKYGVSVSSIQRANKMRGTTINIGKRLIIPRK